MGWGIYALYRDWGAWRGQEPVSDERRLSTQALFFPCFFSTFACLDRHPWLMKISPAIQFHYCSSLFMFVCISSFFLFSFEQTLIFRFFFFLPSIFADMDMVGNHGGETWFLSSFFCFFFFIFQTGRFLEPEHQVRAHALRTDFPVSLICSSSRSLNIFLTGREFLSHPDKSSLIPVHPISSHLVLLSLPCMLLVGFVYSAFFSLLSASFHRVSHLILSFFSLALLVMEGWIWVDELAWLVLSYPYLF